jgi:hypothetical protein
MPAPGGRRKDGPHHAPCGTMEAPNRFPNGKTRSMAGESGGHLLTTATRLYQGDAVELHIRYGGIIGRSRGRPCARPCRQRVAAGPAWQAPERAPL